MRRGRSWAIKNPQAAEGSRGLYWVLGLPSVAAGGLWALTPAWTSWAEEQVLFLTHPAKQR